MSDQEAGEPEPNRDARALSVAHGRPPEARRAPGGLAEVEAGGHRLTAPVAFAFVPVAVVEGLPNC